MRFKGNTMWADVWLRKRTVATLEKNSSGVSKAVRSSQHLRWEGDGADRTEGESQRGLERGEGDEFKSLGGGVRDMIEWSGV